MLLQQKKASRGTVLVTECDKEIGVSGTRTEWAEGETLPVPVDVTYRGL